VNSRQRRAIIWCNYGMSGVWLGRMEFTRRMTGETNVNLRFFSKSIDSEEVSLNPLSDYSPKLTTATR
jgi:hypothetical protein